MKLVEGFPSPAGPDPVHSGLWTEPRLTVRAWLEDIAPSLAELYVGAVELLHSDQKVPGWTRFVAHAVAEIRNRLPDELAPPDSRQRLRYSTEVSKVADQWDRAGFSGNPGNPGSKSPAGASVPVPYELFEAVQSLVRQHQDATGRVEDKAERLFLSAAPENEDALAAIQPVIGEWRRATRFFREHDHDGGKRDQDHDHAAFLANFEVVERSLAGFAMSFFDTLDELDEILDEANQ